MVVIYKITCLINNWVYVGVTVNMYQRKHTHKSALKKGNHGNKQLQNDYNKYGENSFVFEIVEECADEIRIDRETFWINSLKELGIDLYNYYVNNAWLPEYFEHKEKQCQTLKTTQRSAIS